MKFLVIPTLYLCPFLALCQAPTLDIPYTIVFQDLPTQNVPIPEIPNVGSYDPYRSRQEQNTARVMADVDTYMNKTDPHNARVQGLIDNAVTQLYKPQIQYSLPASRKAGKELFYQALYELAAMLRDSIPVDLMRATYLVEHAYDPSIPFEYFDDNIKQAATHILMKLEQEGFDRSDNLAKNMMIFRYMADTLEVNYPGIEQPVLTYPKTYDFDDFWGRQDYSNMFVSKLLRDGDGQCHSMPLLYLLIAEQIDAQASLAFAPNHSYIKFQDHNKTWHTLELTVGAISSENFIIEGGFVKSEAIKSKIYLQPTSEKEVIAQTINDLVMAYTRKYGHDNDKFIQEAVAIAYEAFPHSITTHQIMANYYQDRLNYVIHQYQKHGYTKEQFEADPNAQALVKRVTGANKHIDQLGYAPMPEQMYEDWLESVREQSNGQYNKVKMEQLNSLIKK